MELKLENHFGDLSEGLVLAGLFYAILFVFGLVNLRILRHNQYAYICLKDQFYLVSLDDVKERI